MHIERFYFDPKKHGTVQRTFCTKNGCRRARAKETNLCDKHLAIRIKGEAQAALARTAYQLRPGGRVVRLYAITDGSAVKFGVSTDTGKRLASLQTANPNKLQLLSSIYCSEAVESDVHSYLKPSRINGEWFKWDARAKAIVLLMKAQDLYGLLDFIGVPVEMPAP